MVDSEMTAHAPDQSPALNLTLAPLTAPERLRWAARTFGDDLVLLSSMQRTAVVLMHMFSDLGLPNEILFLDTGYHFTETLRMRDELLRRYRLNLVTLYPALTIEEQEARHGKKLYGCVDGQPECCRLRKEAPLLAHLQSRSTPVVTNGLRRAEGGPRANLQPLTPDPRTGGYQLAPLFDWTGEQVQAYLEEHALPVHPLHARGYPSIGCSPCTTPVAPGEAPRAGRWRHLRPATGEGGPQYCKVNFTDGAGI
jgi:phosphoadenosine phosphosulfate reductase